MQRESTKSLSLEKWDLPADGNTQPGEDKPGPKQDAEKTDERVTHHCATGLSLGKALACHETGPYAIFLSERSVLLSFWVFKVRDLCACVPYRENTRT